MRKWLEWIGLCVAVLLVQEGPLAILPRSFAISLSVLLCASGGYWMGARHA